MKTYRTLKIGLTLIFLTISSAGYCASEAPKDWRITGRTHLTAAWTDLEGPGISNPGLAQTYDLSMFDILLGSKHTRFNGAGVTNTGSAASFPLVDGEAIVQNTKIGFTGPLADDLKAGVNAEIYSFAGERSVAQVFGPEIPWGNLPRERGAIELPHFWADFYSAWLEGKKDTAGFKFLAGTLPPEELPAFTRGEFNQVNLGSLVWRAPGTNESYYEKSDFKYVSGRHAVRGFDFLGTYDYAEKRKITLETFAAVAEPTPITAVDRNAYGGRIASDIGSGNIGLTTVYNEGIRSAIEVEETQWVWALDASYPVTDKLSPFITVAGTDYDSASPDESHWGAAYVAGALLKLPMDYELKAQYQRVEENYDLMGYHKKEHYPGNSEGPALWLTGPLGPSAKLKLMAYHVTQIEIQTNASDTLFGDNYFASDAGSEKGTIDAERIEVTWKIVKPLSFRGYVEHAAFRKTFVTAATSVDKDVFNYYGSFQVPITDRLLVQGGLRHFFSVGYWQTTPFRAYQNAPEAAVIYKLDKNRHASLIYHRLEYQDNTGPARGRNDYHGHQLLAEVRTTF